MVPDFLNNFLDQSLGFPLKFKREPLVSTGIKLLLFFTLQSDYTEDAADTKPDRDIELELSALDTDEPDGQSEQIEVSNTGRCLGGFIPLASKRKYFHTEGLTLYFLRRSWIYNLVSVLKMISC